MCGRYSLFVPPDELADQFGVDVEAYQPTYNAAPGQQLPVITDQSSSQLRRLEWGLIPEWADERSDGGHINARAETLTERASFRDAFEQSGGELAAGRCLVPADGFYEWVEEDGGKQPYRVAFEDDRPFAMAGLWTQWRPPTTQTGLDAFTGGGASTEAEIVESFTIVTTEPNELVGELHHRMAVILPKKAQKQWLTGDPGEVQELLAPYSPAEMCAYPVSTAVNDPANDRPELIGRAE